MPNSPIPSISAVSAADTFDTKCQDVRSSAHADDNMSAALPLYRVEFPDYDDVDLHVRLPASLVDVSWRNDGCPRFLDEGAGLSLWCDYADVSRSEARQCGFKRYTLHRTGPDGLPEEGVGEADTLSDILAVYAALRMEG